MKNYETLLRRQPLIILFVKDNRCFNRNLFAQVIFILFFAVLSVAATQIFSFLHLLSQFADLQDQHK